MERQHCYLLRRVVLLVCLLAGSIGIGAQTDVSPIESGKVYRITHKNQTLVALADYGGTNLVGSTDWTGKSYNSLWTVTTSETGGYTVANVATGRYMQGVNGSGTQATMSDTEQICYISSAGTENYFNILPSANGGYSLNLYGGQWTSPIKGHEKSDGGSMWQFAEVSPTEANVAGLSSAFKTGFLDEINDNYGLVRIATSSDGKVLTDIGGEMRVADKATDLSVQSNWNQVWLIQPLGSGYTLRNLATGKYPKHGEWGNDIPFPTSETPEPVYVRKSPYEDGFNISINTTKFDDGWQTLRYNQGSEYVYRWTSYWSNWSNSGLQDKCGFTIEAVENIDLDLVAKHVATLDGRAIPTTGKVYRLVSNHYGTAMKCDAETGGLSAVKKDAEYSQYWEVASEDGTHFTLRSVLTGMYLKTGLGQGAAYPASTFIPDGTFAIEPIAKLQSVCTITDTDERGLHVKSDGSVINWATSASASEWYFEEVALSDADWTVINAGVRRVADAMVALEDAMAANHNLVRLTTDRTNGYVIGEDESNKLRLQAPDEANLRQVWVLTKSGDYYLFCNLVTGRYIDRSTGSIAQLSTNAGTRNYRIEVSADATKETPLFNMHHENATDYAWYYDGTSDYLQLQTVGTDKGWGFSVDAATDITLEQRQACMYALNNRTGWVAPQAGKIYKIVNQAGGTPLSHDEKGKATPSNNKGLYICDEGTSAIQYWRLAAADGGKFTLQNLKNNKFIQHASANDARYEVGETSAAFTIGIDPNNVEYYNIKEDDGYGLNWQNADGVVKKRVLTNDGARWHFEEFTEDDIFQSQVMEKLPEVLTHNGLVRITTERSNGYVISDGGKDNGYKLTLVAPDAKDLSQVWIMSGSGNNYTFRNVATGRYIDHTEDKFTELGTVTASTTHYVNGALVSTEANPLFNISHPDAKDVCWYHRSADNVLITNSTDVTLGSAFRFTAAKDVTVADVQASLYKGEGWSVPETGKYYRIYNGYWSSSQGRTDEVITEEDGKLTTTAVSSDDKAEVWLLTSADGTNFSFKNLSTGNCIQSQTTNPNQYTTGATKVTFRIGESASLPGPLQKWYNITDTDGDALKMENHKVVNNSLASETIQSNWRFKEVDTNIFSYTTEHKTKTLDELINDHNGIVMVRSVRNGALSKVMAPKTDASGLYLETLADNLTDEANWNQVWYLQRTNDASPYTYTFRNLGSGEYIQEGRGLGQDKHNFYIQASTKTTGAFNIAKTNTFDESTQNSFNEQGGGIGWWWAHNDTGSDWYIEPVQDITLDQVKEHFGDPVYTTPQNGKYYKIVSREYGDVITAIVGSNNMAGQEYANFPSQWWKITVNGSNYTFQNAATEKYIQGDPGSGSSFSLGTSAASFQLNTSTDGHYAIYQSLGKWSGSLHQSESQSDKIVSWGHEDKASRWYFEEVTLSDEEIEAQVTAYQEYMNATDATKLSATYLAFFTDASATKLKSEYQNMTDEELREAMGARAIPAGLQNEALKVKNNAWEPWEREFRVADYNIYSDANDWAGYLQVMAWGVMNNPTGVVAQKGDVVYVVVGSDIPANTTLTLEARKYYDVGDGATQSITLQKGLNAIPIANDGSHIYVRYETDFGTVTKDNKASHPDVADYPSLNIHVIGGQVHGYVDKAKHTDADWVGMLQNGLFWAEQTDLLGECSQVRLQTDFATQNGDQIIRLIDMYDWYVGTELDVMGVTAVPEEYKDLPDYKLAYEDIYPKKVNNRLLCISKKDEGGNPYGAAYHIYVPGSGNYLYDNLKNKDGGSAWVFGHEWGHVNQGPINIAASNEASNNLYPNILANRGGYSTSRGWNVQELQRKMANERSVNASGQYESQFGVTNENYLEKCGPYSWPRTVLSWDDIGKHFTPAQMFYQLYLYYHAAGHNPLFYPRLFNEMRQDPLRQGAKGNEITGWSDYLHFAMKACDAAGENLEDFFEAWGFFVPVYNYFVECYSQWYITTTEKQISDALAYMRKYDRANESIIFIDDRATVSYQADGVTPKVPFDDGNSVENCKTDFAGAQYSAFNGEASQPNGLAYTTSTDEAGNTVVTINTDVAGVTNAAGVKFYDADGKLVYFASQTNITIPTNLTNEVDLSKTKISLSDGTTMPLYEEGATDVFLQTIHHGDGTTSTRYTKGGDGAILDPDRDGKNAIALITVEEGETLDEAISSTPNVAVNNVLHTISLTDKVDYGVGAGNARNAVSLSAKNIEYKGRNLYQGWNTLCLPFAITVADFGEGAKLEVLKEVKTDDGGDLLYFRSVNEVAAGQPCLLYVPEGNASWTYERTNAEPVAVTTTAQVTEANFYMNGGFVNKNIGAGHYKLVQNGDAFAKTTSAAVTFPFRAYISTGAGAEGASFVRAFHFFEDTETGITAPTATEQSNRTCYDLQGRKVKTPQRGVVYILGGQKVMFE